MATKKQQRRRYQRAQGRGRLYDDGDEAGSGERRRETRPRGRGEPPRPTWRRAFRRAGLFALGLFVFVQLIPFGGTKIGPGAAAIQAASFFVFLVPFGYLMDGFLYNRWLKRQQG
jgi:hypothetical protein